MKFYNANTIGCVNDPMFLHFVMHFHVGFVHIYSFDWDMNLVTLRWSDEDVKIWNVNHYLSLSDSPLSFPHKPFLSFFFFF